MSLFPTLKTRSLSAVVYGLVVLGAILGGQWPLFVFLSIAAVLLHLEFSRLILHDQSVKLHWPDTVLAVMPFMVALWWPQFDITWLVVLPLVVFSGFVLSQPAAGMMRLLIWSSTQFYLLLPLWLAKVINTADQTYQPYPLLAVILWIWINDSGAYFIGSAWGKHKMYPAVSPGKSWEGTLGGLVIAGLSGFWLGPLWLELNGWQGVLLAVAVGVAATVGDLFESMLKRTAGVKDSGTIMPGHGGLLDRLDSFLFAVPAYYLVMEMISR